MDRDTLLELLNDYRRSGNPDAVLDYIYKHKQNDNSGFTGKGFETHDGWVEAINNTDSEQTIYPAEGLAAERVIDDTSVKTLNKTITLDNGQNIDAETTFFRPKSKIPPLISPELKAGYTELGLLGKGGMGAVWRVADPNLRRQIAMKVMHRKLVSNPHEAEAFIEEAQISAQLQHRGIVPVHEMGELPTGELYFTMREIKGKTFKAITSSVHQVSKGGQWRPAEDGWNFRRLIAAFENVCQTVAYAHSRGVIHRDLKPSNIMVGDYGEIWVVDWGIAKLMPESALNVKDAVEPIVVTDRTSKQSHESNTGTITGTPAYMSPEQALGEDDMVDGRSDVYSLGVILYHLLSGKMPYTGSAQTLLRRKPIQPPKPIRTVSVSEDGKSNLGPIPEALAKICDRAMARHPKDRFQTVRDMSNALLRWIEGAQRQDKALKALEAANEVLNEINRLAARSDKEWNAAEDSLEMDQEKEPWDHYLNALADTEKLEHLKIEFQHALHGVLIHDPEFVNAHRQLCDLIFADCKQAQSDQNQRMATSLARRLADHIDMLPESEQLLWRNKLHFDPIERLAINKGRLIGRRSICNKALEQLTHSNWISLTGTAGVGKTHVALKVACDWAQINHGYAAFCDLTEAMGRQDIFRALGNALNLVLAQDAPLNQITDSLNRKPACLLVLDNLEHLIDQIKPIMSHLRANVPKLKLLITSRVSFKNEHEVSLPIPTLSKLAGVELFVHQAQQAKPDFKLTPQNREAILRIVTKLDRLPLAIQLAAARITMLTATQIEKRLSERFTLLRGRIRHQKQVALDTALEWSWGLLSEWGQLALSQCAVFCEGFSLEAAEAVLKWKKGPPVLDALAALCDDSLLICSPSSDGSYRYTMLRSIFDFSKAKAAEQADRLDWNQLKGRHARYYATLPMFLLGDDNPHVLNMPKEHKIELANLIAASQCDNSSTALKCLWGAIKIVEAQGPIKMSNELIARKIAQGNLSPQQKLYLRQSQFKARKAVGHNQNAIDTLENVLKEWQAPSNPTKMIQCQTIPDNAKINLLLSKGLIEQLRNRPEEAILCCNAILDSFSERDFPYEIMIAAKLRGISRFEMADLKKALESYRFAIKIADRLGHQKEHLQLKANSALVLREMTDYEQAIITSENCLQKAREYGNTHIEMLIVSNHAIINQDLGQTEMALNMYKYGLDLAEKVGDTRMVGNILSNLGTIYQGRGQNEKAMQHYRRSLSLLEAHGLMYVSSTVYGNIGLMLEEQGNPSEALTYFKKSLAIAQDIKAKGKTGFSYGLMASALAALNRSEEALNHWKQAIEICSETFPPAAAAFQSKMGYFMGIHGELKAGLDLITDALPKLTTLAEEQGIAMCKRGKLLILSHEMQLARDALSDATSIMIKTGVPKEGRLGVAIGELKKALRHAERRSLLSSQQEDTQ